MYKRVIVGLKSKGRSCSQGTTVLNTMSKMSQTVSIKLTTGNPIQLPQLYYELCKANLRKGNGVIRNGVAQEYINAVDEKEKVIQVAGRENSTEYNQAIKDICSPLKRFPVASLRKTTRASVNLARRTNELQAFINQLNPLSNMILLTMVTAVKPKVNHLPYNS